MTKTVFLKILQKAYKKTATVTFDKDNLSYNIHINNEPDFTNFLDKPSKGDKSLEPTWNKLEKENIKLSKAMKEVLGHGYTLSVVNPDQEHSAVLSTSDGVTVYNFYEAQKLKDM